MTVDRYGINKNNIGPLAKASFEQTEDIMLRAALFGELDPITGVSANIMTGQTIRGGTSYSSILLDEDALKKFIGESSAAPSNIPTSNNLLNYYLDEDYDLRDDQNATRYKKHSMMTIFRNQILSTESQNFTICQN
jgi:hypothetical protein